MAKIQELKVLAWMWMALLSLLAGIACGAFFRVSAVSALGDETTKFNGWAMLYGFVFTFVLVAPVQLLLAALDGLTRNVESKDVAPAIEAMRGAPIKRTERGAPFKSPYN